MSGLTASQLLAVWEHGAAQLPIQRALALLAVAFPAESPDALAALSIGQRDARLFALRQQLFGSRLAGLAECPVCAERVELSLPVDELIATAPHPPDGECQLEQDGYQVSYHLPDSHDLLAVSAASRSLPPEQDGCGLLAQRCIRQVTRAGQMITWQEIPGALIDALSQHMAKADPLADIWLSLSCPACGHHWQARFDIATYLWREIDTWASRTLWEVHRLARAYGWSEAEILSISAWRRQYYLSLL